MKLESNERAQRGGRKWRQGAGLVVLALVAVAGRADEHGDESAWQERLNLNTSTRAEFGGIPGVGNRMVREFMEYRPYVSIRQFRREIGKYVNEEQVAAYEQYVFVPIDPNAADAETLQQIPGVDAEIAAALIEARMYADSAAFLAQLTSLVEISEDDQQVVEAMLVAEEEEA